MKKITYLILAVLGIGFLASCEKDFDNPVLNVDNTQAPVMNMGFTEMVLDTTIAADSITFNWDAVEYDVTTTAAPTYRLQMKHADSSEFVELASTVDTYFKTTVEDFNNFLLGEGFPTEEALNIELRVFTFITPDAPSTEVYSESSTVAFTAYAPPEPPPSTTPKLWVPGDYQGWSPADAPNVYSPADNGVYQGYVYFPPDGTFEFKFTSDPDWSHTNFGNGGDGVLDTDDGAGNLTVPGEGTYYFTVNVDELTWSHEVLNFALIGTFNDWSGDEPLTWDADNQVFTITMDFDADAEFKWRANADWAVNFGINDPDDGTLVQDGGNIVIEEAGNYTVILDLYNEVPTYELIKN